jgi:hypothetical protein
MSSVLLDLVRAVSKVEERLDAQEASEETRRELLRLVVREAVQEALAPLESRVNDLESNVKFVKWAGAIASAVAPVVGWLLPRLVALVPVFLILGCGALPPAKDIAQHQVEEFCFDSPTSRREILSDAEASACERMLNSR